MNQETAGNFEYKNNSYKWNTKSVTKGYTFSEVYNLFFLFFFVANTVIIHIFIKS